MHGRRKGAAIIVWMGVALALALQPLAAAADAPGYYAGTVLRNAVAPTHWWPMTPQVTNLMMPPNPCPVGDGTQPCPTLTGGGKAPDGVGCVDTGSGASGTFVDRITGSSANTGINGGACSVVGPFPKTVDAADSLHAAVGVWGRNAASAWPGGWWLKPGAWTPGQSVVWTAWVYILTDPQTRLHLFETDAHWDGSGTVDGPNSLYVNLPDRNQVCWGLVGGTGSCSTAFAGHQRWAFLEMYLAADTMTMYVDSQMVGQQVTVGHAYSMANLQIGVTSERGYGQVCCGQANDSSAFGEIMEWGQGFWLGHNADVVGAPNCGAGADPAEYICGTNGVNGWPLRLWSGNGSGSDLPSNVGVPPPPPSARGVTCAPGTDFGPISHECKWLIPTIGKFDCQAPGSIWNIGADIGYGLCNLGNVFVACINGVIGALNYVVDLLEPSGSLTQPIGQLWAVVSSKAPFAYAIGTVDGLTTAFAAPASTSQTVTIGPMSFNPLALGAQLGPYNAIMTACVVALGAFGIYRMVKADLAGEAG
jgi:hypothetical protein